MNVEFELRVPESVSRARVHEVVMQAANLPLKGSLGEPLGHVDELNYTAKTHMLHGKATLVTVSDDRDHPKIAGVFGSCSQSVLKTLCFKERQPKARSTKKKEPFRAIKMLPEKYKRWV